MTPSTQVAFADTAASMADRPAHKDAPDTVRALSAVVVVVSHAVQIIWFPQIGLGTWTHWTNSFLSDTAVIVFFVLSGYMITASICANLARHGHFRVGDYAFSRFVRIYPPLLCAALLWALVFGIMLAGDLPGTNAKLAFTGDLYTARETVTVTGTEIVNALTMRNGLLAIDGPLWSLYVEVKLYAIAGLIAYCALGPAARPIRIVLTCAALWIAYAASLGITPPQYVYCAWWLGGASLYLAGRRWPALRATSVVAAPLVVLVLWLSSTRIDLEAIRLAAVMLLSYGVFFRWSWRQPLAKSVAGYSYTLYLVHFPIMILAYALFVKFAGPNAPDAAWRIAVAVLGIGASLLCARQIGAFAEDAARIKTGLRSWTGRAKSGLPT